MSRRNDFLNQQAPENYVAGLGRGATGFTTRSDLGPAREGPSEDQIKEALAKRAAQLGQAPPTAYGAPEKKEQDDDDDDRFQDPDNEVGLFANGSYGADDDEADNIFQSIDDKMAKRRRRQREAREQKEREEYERNNPKISQQFSDLKRALGSVTDEDWANIPEAGDYTKKNKRTKQNERQRFYAVPDSVIQGGMGAGLDTSISANGDGPGESANGDEADGTATNFAAFGEARNRVLQVRLDQAAQGESTKGDASVGGTSTNIDPKGYLTSLSKMDAGEVNVGDIARVRGLLGSLTKTNPKNANGWIAAARVEEVAGKVNAARRIIAQGCQECPKNEDCWLENMRLNDNHNAKIIAASAIKLNDRSVRLWTEAMKLENDTRSKKRVLRQALDHIPQSVALWKEAVNLEDDEADARLLLHKATEIIPLSVELWLALARLETPEQAQVVLNKARKAVPTSHEIWIAACRLQEQLGENSRVETIMRRAIQALVKESAMLKREEWITEAEKCEEEGAILTCNAIIRETLGYGLDEDDDRKDLWMSEAKESIGRGVFGTARAIYAYTLRVFYHSKSAWLAAADLERNHGTSVGHQELLEKAVEACPQSQELWMELAKEMRQSGRIDDARRVLGRAFNQNPGNEDIWLKAVDLESDNGQADEARKLLTAARQEAGTDRVWIKSVAFERQLGNTGTALDLVNSGLERYPKAPKLYMMKGQIYQSNDQIAQAREAFRTGTKMCPSSADLWLLYSRLEEYLGENVSSRVNKARAILERARVAVPKNEKLWTETVRLERRAKNLPAAQQNMARAMQDVAAKDSGMLWEEQIWHLEPRNKRKALALEAIKKVDNSAILFVTVARIFWSERRLEKAANWFEKALLLDPDRGDTWGWYLKFLNEHGTREKREDITSKCVLNEPRHGEVWQQVSKDPQNARKGIEQILGMVVTRLE